MKRYNIVTSVDPSGDVTLDFVESEDGLWSFFEEVDAEIKSLKLTEEYLRNSLSEYRKQ